MTAQRDDFDPIWLVPILGTALLVGVLVACVCRRRSRRTRHDETKRMSDMLVDSGAGFGWVRTPNEVNHRVPSHTVAVTETASPPGQIEVHEYSTDDLERLLITDPVVGATHIAMDELTFETSLSSSTFSEVWRCDWEGTPVAIKRLVASKHDTFDHLTQFIHEILLTASLSHPNIIRYIGVAWTTMDDVSMALELLPNGDLQQYISSHWDLLMWPTNKLRMAIGVARAVEYLHALSPTLVHRNLKASNVLLTDAFEVKLIDFAVSRDRVQETMATGVGTPYWAAPEVLDGSRGSEKSDIYSFGVLLSEMDTGELPYQRVAAQTTGEILNMVIAGKLRPSFRDDCPQPIVLLATRCMDADANKRPTASELVELLYGIFNSRQVHSGSTQNLRGSSSFRRPVEHTPSLVIKP